MSEPTRLRDEGPDAVRALLRHAPRTSAMTAVDKARTRGRVARLAGLAVGVGSLAWFQGAAIGAGLGVLAVGAAEIAPALLAPPASIATVTTPAARPPRGAAAVSAAPTAEPPPPPESAEPEAPRPAARPAAPFASAPVAEVDSLAEEASLLERARAALGQSPAEALSLAETHAARFPAGKLATERELVALDALRRLGRVAEARARGEALLSHARGGLYEERIRKLLDGAR